MVRACQRRSESRGVWRSNHGRWKPAQQSRLGITTVKQVLDIDLDEGILNVAHHPPGGAVLYQGTKLDRIILWNILQAATKMFPDATWIVRSHMHEWSLMKRKGRTAVITPPWQLPTPWAVKQNREGYASEIGYVLMLEDADSSDGWKFVEKTYKPPMATVYTKEELAAKYTGVYVGDGEFIFTPADDPDVAVSWKRFPDDPDAYSDVKKEEL